MSSSVEPNENGKAPEIMHPRARRSLRSSVLSSQQDEDKLAPMGYHQIEESHPSSETSTPVPPNAPPSVQATSSARKAIRAQQKRRMFPTVDYHARVSHFDPRSEHRDFRGFFVLFWIGLAVMVITTMLRNFKETGYPFVFRQRNLFVANIWELAISEFFMAGSAVLCLPLHLLYARSDGFFRWRNGGKWVQSAFQAAWLSYWCSWPFMRDWTWTAQVYFTLHFLTILMKMHSYAFYNGHLSETKRRLDSLDKPNAASKAAAVRYPLPGGRLHGVKPEATSPTSPIASLTDQQSTNSSPLSQLREDLAVELTSPLGRVSYSENLSLSNFLDFLCCPTLCYELEYPRTDRIHWSELCYKTAAVFGCIFLLTITSEHFVMPVLDESALRLSTRQSLTEAALILGETVSTLLFPFMVIFLLVFLVIFEYLLGAFAEMTRFADRNFYDDWWNSCDWLEFSREWNIPVHNFLQRHVYAAMSRPSRLPSESTPVSTRRMSSSMPDHKREPSDPSQSQATAPLVSRPVATFITFLISALAHELVMGCITKKLRGYGAIAMMLQMPIVMVQRSRWIRGRKLLNNILFWCSMILGLSMMCALYVLL